MNYFFLIIKSALFDFSRNKGRTFLTSLGILIGVLSVILLMALGLGLKKYISDQFDSLGANLVYVLPGSKKSYFKSGGVGGIKFDNNDVKKLKRITNIDKIAPSFSKPGAEVSVNGKSEVLELVGSTEDMNSIMNLQALYGRLIEKKDVEKKSKSAVISETTAAKFFETAIEAIGKNISMEGQTFRVIGVYKSKGGGIGGGVDEHIYAPNTALYAFNPDKKYYAIYLKTVSKDDIPQVKKDIDTELKKRYDEDQFSVMDQSEIMSTVSSIFSIINTVLISIAAISLVVGGIGIMNIMYVTVTERIREIGIRRALGAHKEDILYQFLIESVFLSVMGGVLGVALAFVIVYFVQPIFPAYVDAFSVAIALGVSSAIGIVFGVFPAKKAAELSPIEAIHYE